MKGADAKERILDAAERLFSEEGLDGVSVRAVTAEAGLNVAAVNYHFGSKAALLSAMVRRFFARVSAERLRRLDELEVSAGGKPPPVEDLVVAFAVPVFELFDEHRAREWGQAWMATRGTDGQDRGVSPMTFGETEVERRYQAALGQTLPWLSSEELRWRLERANSLLMANQGRRVMGPAATGATVPAAGEERRWLITFLTGALGAPSSIGENTSNGQEG
ncbi:MAG: TetR family transcriptional regulator [Rubrobacteraceae bacterium]